MDIKKVYTSAQYFQEEEQRANLLPLNSGRERSGRGFVSQLKQHTKNVSYSDTSFSVVFET
jgi:hypothetical protein